MKRKNRDTASEKIGLTEVVEVIEVIEEKITPWEFKSKESLNTGFVNVQKEIIFFTLPHEMFVASVASYLTALEFSHFFLLNKSIIKQINPIAKLYFNDKIERLFPQKYPQIKDEYPYDIVLLVKNGEAKKSENNQITRTQMEKFLAENVQYRDKPLLIYGGDFWSFYGYSSNEEWELNFDLDQKILEGLKPSLPQKKSTTSLVSMGTRGGGDCAFHAILGEWNPSLKQYVCPHVDEKRRIVQAAVMAEDKNLAHFIVEGIRELVLTRRDIGPESRALIRRHENFLTQDDSSSLHWGSQESSLWLEFEMVLRGYPVIIEYIKNNHSPFADSFRYQFYSALNHREGELYGCIFSLPDLQRAFKHYNDLSNRKFNWKMAVLSNPALKKEYSEFLGEAHHWYLVSELAIIAQIFGRQVNYYPAPKAAAMVLNPDEKAKTTIYVQFNGVNHYERLLSVNFEARLLSRSQVPKAVFEEINKKKAHQFSGKNLMQNYQDFHGELYHSLTTNEKNIFNSILENDFYSFIHELQPLRNRNFSNPIPVREIHDQPMIEKVIHSRDTEGNSFIRLATRLQSQKILNYFFQKCLEYIYAIYMNRKDYDWNDDLLEQIKKDLQQSRYRKVYWIYSLAFISRQELYRQIEEIPGWSKDFTTERGFSLLICAILLNSEELFVHALQGLSQEEIVTLLQTQHYCPYGYPPTAESVYHSCDITPFQLACLFNSPSLMETILQVGSLDIYDPDPDLIEYLHWAIGKQDIGIVRSLLEKRVNVEGQGHSEKFFTPLMRAANINSVPIVQLLLEHKAQINADTGPEDNECINPLAAGIWGGSVDSVRYLIQAGADTNHRCDYTFNVTPLEDALKLTDREERLEIVKLLVENKSSLETFDEKGSILQQAVCRKFIEIVKYLITLKGHSSIDYGIFSAAARSSYRILSYLASQLPPLTLFRFIQILQKELSQAASSSLAEMKPVNPKSPKRVRIENPSPDPEYSSSLWFQAQLRINRLIKEKNLTQLYGKYNTITQSR